MLDRERLEMIAYTALRILAGTMLAIHGSMKLFGAFGASRVAITSQLGIGGIIELACGLAVALGFFTRLAAFVLAGQLAVAYFQFHWKLDFLDWRFVPQVNKGELALVYCFVFLLVWLRGAGPYSLDRKRGHA